MQPSQGFSVPNWVRSTICLTACASVLLLIVAACLDVTVGFPLSFVVGAYAIRGMNLAFSNTT